MSHNKLLTIAVPTYNRQEKVLGQVKFLIQELQNIEESDIDFIVGDNCSNDNTYYLLNELRISCNIKIRIIRNSENLGLVGNVDSLIKECTTKYIWLIGDDDIIVKGALKKVLGILQMEKDIAFVFLNHDGINPKDDQVLMEKAFTAKYNYFANGKDAIANIFLESKTSLMFITACIFRTDTLKDSIEKKENIQLVDPLYYSFLASSKGGVYILDEILIHSYWHENSWKNEKFKVLYYGVLSVLIELKDLGYTDEVRKKLIRDYLENFIFYQIKHLFNDNGFSFRLLRYLEPKMVLKKLKKKFRL